MLKIFKILVLTIFINSAFAVDEECRGTDCIGEASLEVMQGSSLITVANFMRKNRTMSTLDINTLCRMNKQFDFVGREIKVMESILKDNNMDVENFKEVGFVNADCGNINFVAKAMEDSLFTFRKWVDFGINMNRPIIFKGKVGTPLDIAMYMIENDPKRVGHWREAARTLLLNKFKKCKDLNIKCSIDVK